MLCKPVENSQCAEPLGQNSEVLLFFWNFVVVWICLQVQYKCTIETLLPSFSLTVLEDAASLGHRIRPCRSLSPKGGILWVIPTAERRPFKSSSDKVKQQCNEISIIWFQSVGQIHVFSSINSLFSNHISAFRSNGCYHFNAFTQ